MMRRLLFASLALFISFFLYSQHHVSVDGFTGRVNFTVPITSINSKGISHPVAIAYSNNGMRAEMANAKLGVGWHLVAGGTITREVQGLPDELETIGWLASGGANVASFNRTSEQNFNSIVGENADYTSINNMGGLLSDTEPDIFSVNVPGLSGSFLFDTDSVIRTIPFNNWRIEFNNTSWSSITITNEEGLKYTFTSYGTVTAHAKSIVTASKIEAFRRDFVCYQTPRTYRNQWYLTEITSPDGGHITFAYRTAPALSGSWNNHVITFKDTRKDTVSIWVPDNGSRDYVKKDLYYFEYSGGQPRDIASISSEIQKIEFKDGQLAIPFLYDIDDGLIKINQPLLNWIDIYAMPKGYLERVRRVKFSYESFFHSNENFSSSIFLRRISESGDVDQRNLFEFDYSGTTSIDLLPKYSSSKKDLFGFYNNIRERDIKAPQTYIFPNETNDAWKISHQMDNSGMYFNITGDDLRYTVNALSYGTLTRVQSGLGGSTIIHYEPNTYYNAKLGKDLYGGGLRVSELQTIDGINSDNVISTRYEYQSQGHSSGVLMQAPLYATTIGHGIDHATNNLIPYAESASYNPSNNPEAWRDILIFRKEFLSRNPLDPPLGTVYSQSQEIRTGIGKTETTYNVDGHWGDGAISGYWSPPKTYLARPSNTYKKTAPLQKTYGYPFGPGTNLTRLGRVEEVQQFDANDNLIGKTTYTYEGTNYPIAIPGITVEKYVGYTTGGSPVDAFIYTPYEIITDQASLPSEVISYAYESGVANPMVSSTHYVYNASDSSNRLDQVYVEHPDGTVSGQKFKYAKEYVGSGADTLVLKTLKAQNRGLFPLEVQSWKEDLNNVVKTLTAQLSHWVNPSADFIYPAVSKRAVFPDGTTTFQELTINSTWNDDSNYDEIATADYVDIIHSNVLTVSGKDGIPVTTVYSYQGMVPVLTATNARADEVIYQDFEMDPDAYPYGKTKLAIDPAGDPGRWDIGSSYNLLYSNNYITVGEDISNASGQLFTFSIWIKAPTAGTFSVRTNGATVSTFAYSGDQWTYYEKEINVGAAYGFTLEIKSDTDIAIDDLIFYPKDAEVMYNSFDDKLRKRITTGSHGESTYTNYDGLGRVVEVLDDEFNIISRQEYPASNNFQLVPSIEYEGFIVEDEETTFYCQSGFDEYYWSVVRASNFTDLESHVFPTLQESDPRKKDYTITSSNSSYDHFVLLKAISGAVEYRTSLFIPAIEIVTEPDPPQAAICVYGPTRYDLCGVDPDQVSKCLNTTPPASGNIKFLAEIVGSKTTVITAVQWQEYDPIYQNDWVNMPGQTGVTMEMTKPDITTYSLYYRAKVTIQGVSEDVLTQPVLIEPYYSTDKCDQQ